MRIWVLGVLLLCGVGFSQGSVRFADLPASHWASDSVDRVTRLGLLVGFPDGSFQGSQSVSRYDLAVVLSRLVDLVNAGLGGVGEGVSRVELLDLALEVEGVLVALAGVESSVGGRLSGLESRLNSLSVRVEGLVEALEGGLLVGPPGPVGPVGPIGPAGPVGPAGASVVGGRGVVGVGSGVLPGVGVGVERGVGFGGSSALVASGSSGAGVLLVEFPSSGVVGSWSSGVGRFHEGSVSVPFVGGVRKVGGEGLADVPVGVSVLEGLLGLRLP